MSKASPKLAAAFAQLDALYAELPTIACKGLCAIACGGVPLTELEARRLQLATHVKPRTVLKVLADGAPHTACERERCIYLREEARCSAYAVRPLICRAWGLIKTLSCMHGCLPDRWLTELDFVRIGQAVEKIGGLMLVTAPEGLLHLPSGGFADVVPAPGRSVAAIEADADRTRTYRALHAGRVISAVTRTTP